MCIRDSLPAVRPTRCRPPVTAPAPVLVGGVSASGVSPPRRRRTWYRLLWCRALRRRWACPGASPRRRRTRYLLRRCRALPRRWARPG
eukprot:12749516-Alexandrium_andersonii.AAC.1